MKKVELYLMYMNKIKTPIQSIDLYFNNLGPEFVVKIHEGGENENYFRNLQLKKAIKDACAFLLEESEK